MISGMIPKRYARALMVHTVKHKRSVEATANELTVMAGLVCAGSGFSKFLSNETINSRDKEKVLNKILAKSGVSAPVSNLLRLLQKRHRLILAAEIAQEFRKLADEAENIIRGQVAAAIDLPENKLASIAEKLSAGLKKKVILTAQKDPSLVGGIVVKIGTLNLDGSLRAQLNNLRQKLMERVNT